MFCQHSIKSIAIHATVLLLFLFHFTELHNCVILSSACMFVCVYARFQTTSLSFAINLLFLYCLNFVATYTEFYFEMVVLTSLGCSCKLFFVICGKAVAGYVCRAQNASLQQYFLIQFPYLIIIVKSSQICSYSVSVCMCAFVFYNQCQLSPTFIFSQCVYFSFRHTNAHILSSS